MVNLFEIQLFITLKPYLSGMERDIARRYSNGEVTIIWQPSKCIHSGICARGLPLVFKPREKPWITPGNTGTQQLIDQVNKCPSGALTWVMDAQDELKKEE